MAVFPLQLIATNPLPSGFLPKVGPGKAKGWVYPDEDAKLVASDAVPLEYRVFYGFLHREGPRVNEAARLTWSDFDLDRGSVVLATPFREEAQEAETERVSKKDSSAKCNASADTLFPSSTALWHRRSPHFAFRVWLLFIVSLVVFGFIVKHP